MELIAPFKAVLFDGDSGSDVTRLVAPPYDVVSLSEADALRAGDPHNIIHVDLPEAAGGLDEYQRAAEVLRKWLAEGVLKAEDRAAYYLWETHFELAGRRLTRSALLAQVACLPSAGGSVIFHELTRKKIQENCLRLFQATGIQASPIFGLYMDEGDEIITLAREAAKPGERAARRFARSTDGSSSQLYVLSDRGIVERLSGVFGDRAIMIADGHHRYHASRAYYTHKGSPGRCLMALVALSDPGLVIQPVHRSIGLDLDGERFVEALAGLCAVERHPYESWPELYAEHCAHPEPERLLVVSPPAGQARSLGQAQVKLRGTRGAGQPAVRRLF